MTQIVVKKEKPCVLTEEFFEAGMFVKQDDDIFITSYDTDREKMLLICLSDGVKDEFTDSSYVQYTILEKGTVLELTV
jgi:hypothetical protein